MELRWVRVAAALLSGLLLYFSLGQNPFWLAAWIAPVPMLLAAFYCDDWREAVLLSYLAVAIGVSSNISYYVKTTGPVATPILLLLIVALWGLFVVRTRAFIRRSASWATVFVFPILLCAATTLVSEFSPHGTAASYAYTQMSALPVIQIASIAGTPGVVFWAALLASTLAVGLYRGAHFDRPWLAYGLAGGILAGVFLFGAIRLATAPAEPTMRIGLASVDDFISARLPDKKVAACLE